MTENKTKNRLPDGLSVGFILVAVFSLLVSVPATFQVAEITHRHTFGAVLVVLLAEVMAFGSKLATRWFPSWYKPLNTFAGVMLASAVLPNAIEGWEALWRPEVDGTWAAIRDTSLFGFPFFAVLIVLVWAALPPVGVYLALTFWVRRQFELETAHTPEAVVERRLQPIIIEMDVQQRLDEQLLKLFEQRQQQFGRLIESSQALQMPLLPAGPSSAPAAPPKVVPPRAQKLDVLLSSLGATREEARQLLVGYGFMSASEAFYGLANVLGLPEGPAQMTLEEFAPLYEELMSSGCPSCGNDMTLGERGVAAKYARKHGGPAVCTACRKGE